MIVSMPGDAGGLGALDDAPILLLLLLLGLLLGLGCSKDPTQALSTAESPLLRVALLLSATGRLACIMQRPPRYPVACRGPIESDALCHQCRCT